MANPYLVLWCDPNNNALYTGWNRPVAANIPVLRQGDTLGVEVHWVRAGTTAQMSEVEFPPSADITLAIGLIDTAPTSGTFKVSYGGQTTGALNYNISAADLQTALNALTSISSEGGVIVAKTNNQYRIVWNNVGSTANTMSVNTDLLSPTSNGIAIVSRVGSATKSQVVLLKLRQAPVAGTTNFTAISEPAISVALESEKNWSIKFTNTPKSGTFRISTTVSGTAYTTVPIAFDASSQEVYDAIKASSTNIGSTSVVSFADGGWEVYVANASNITATSSVKGFSAMYGTVSLNTAELEELISGDNAVSAVLEVQADIDGEVQTLLQTNIVILNDLVDSSAFEVVDLGQVIPAMAVVRYDTSQVLTSAEQLQARTNIGAGVQADIDSIDTRVTTIENDYATSTALTSGLAGKANSTHTHVASDISNSTSVGRTLLTAASAADQRTALGLGTMAVETAANYATVSSLSSYLTTSAASATYLTITNAASLYIPTSESSKIPTSDEKDALVGLSYSATAPSSSNAYLTKADHQTNFQSQTHAIAPNTGTDHNASNVIATGIIASPDSARTWLATVCFNYQATDADLRSDIFWADTSHELNFAPEGTLTPSLIFKRNSFEFVLMAGETGFEIWSTAHAAFSTLAGELYISYRALD